MSRAMRTIMSIVAAMLFAGSALADGLVDKTSPYGAVETIDRLQAVVENAGATVVARVDHAGAAAGADMELRPTSLIIFGNPRLGTPLMQLSQSMGVALPLRVAAYEDEAGATHLVYEDIVELAEDHGIDPNDPAVQNVAEKLNALTDMALAAE